MVDICFKSLVSHPTWNATNTKIKPCHRLHTLIKHSQKSGYTLGHWTGNELRNVLAHWWKVNLVLSASESVKFYEFVSTVSLLRRTGSGTYTALMVKTDIRNVSTWQMNAALNKNGLWLSRWAKTSQTEETNWKDNFVPVKKKGEKNPQAGKVYNCIIIVCKLANVKWL